MRSPKRQPLCTLDEYLTMERASKDRHEYVDGQIRAMAGESPEHGDITVNLVISLGTQLKGTSCRARTKDTKVRSGPFSTSGHSTAGLFSYPDIVVVCGEPEYHDAYKDVILNPKVIVEVLSPTTEAFDRGEKFTRYQIWNPTLSDYLLVAQDRPEIGHFSRQEGTGWSYHVFTDLEASVAIPSIQCTLKLAEVYELGEMNDRVLFVEGRQSPHEP